MESLARIALVVLAIIVAKHAIEGGTKQTKRWLQFVFLGRDAHGRPVASEPPGATSPFGIEPENAPKGATPGTGPDDYRGPNGERHYYSPDGELLSPTSNKKQQTPFSRYT